MRELIKNQVNSNHLARAGSITDSSVLRRKGRLKEQDALIEFIVELHKTHTTEEVFTKVETWIDEVLELPKEKRRFSKLSRMVPAVGFFFHRLPLLKALREYDEFSSLSKRRYVLPNFAEVRHILNIAQVHASSKDVRLVTFDADGTLYADGEHFEDDNKMIDKIMQLMELGIHVAIVTAAGYPGEPTKFEGRLKGLVDAFEAQALPKEVREKFHVMGGECNYLLRVNDEYRLEFVPSEEWHSEHMYDWRDNDDCSHVPRPRGRILDLICEALGRSSGCLAQGIRGRSLAQGRYHLRKLGRNGAREPSRAQRREDSILRLQRR
jgi:IMP and pyridine-specific 5'-nucleotidase